MLDTTVSTDPPKVDGGIVTAASLAEVGATSDTKFSGGEVQGFILDVPEGVDEAEAVQKLSSHQDVMRVVPDTWVGIAAATGKVQQDQSQHNHKAQLTSTGGDEQAMR